MAKVVIKSNGDKVYYDDNGFVHREDGPAEILAIGTKMFFRHGLSILSEQYNTPDEGIEGDKCWFDLNGDFHRSNGPADDYPNGYKVWYTNGDQVWPKLK